MKRFSSSDSVGAMLYSHEEETSKEKLVYSSEFQAMLDSLDDEGCSEEHIIGKKRRLSIVQVHALEKIFEVDNKLDPERKVKLAQELGLQPRQVAIWFQNRRARWKTKQLERDYNILKNDYDNLQLNRNKAEEEKEKLIAELHILKKKLGEENNNESSNGKTTLVMSNDHQNIDSEQYGNGSFSKHEKSSSKMNNHHEVTELMFKDGSSDSDSSGILIHEHNNLQMMNSHHHYHQQVLLSNPASCSMEYYPRPSQMVRGNHQQHSLKTEELSLFSTGLEQEPPCNIFSVDQPPNLHWYFPSDHH